MGRFYYYHYAILTLGLESHDLINERDVVVCREGTMLRARLTAYARASAVLPSATMVGPTPIASAADRTTFQDGQAPATFPPATGGGGAGDGLSNSTLGPRRCLTPRFVYRVSYCSTAALAQEIDG